MFKAAQIALIMYSMGCCEKSVSTIKAIEVYFSVIASVGGHRRAVVLQNAYPTFLPTKVTSRIIGIKEATKAVVLPLPLVFWQMNFGSYGRKFSGYDASVEIFLSWLPTQNEICGFQCICSCKLLIFSSVHLTLKFSASSSVRPSISGGEVTMGFNGSDLSHTSKR